MTAATFGRIYGDADRPSFVTDTGIAVWMWRKGHRVRFLTVLALIALGGCSATKFPPGYGKIATFRGTSAIVLPCPSATQRDMFFRLRHLGPGNTRITTTGCHINGINDLVLHNDTMFVNWTDGANWFAAKEWVPPAGGN